jgi:predicted HicB family RNase H-like nuclease
MTNSSNTEKGMGVKHPLEALLLRVNPALKRRLEAMAEKNNRSLSAEGARLLERALNRTSGCLTPGASN